MAKPWLHQRKSHARINGFPPTKTEALHQHARHFGHIGIGIRIGRAPTNHHQEGLIQGHLTGRLIQGFADAGTSRTDHQTVDPELASVVDRETRFGAVGVQHRRNVVLGVASREQHGGNSQNPLNALIPQSV